MKTISFCSIKGGTGKSTLSIITALSLFRQRLRVLAIDLDPQNSTTFFFADDVKGKSIFNVLMGDKAENNIIKTKYGVDLIPSDLRLLDHKIREVGWLKNFLNQKINNNYDYVIIDSAPTYDNLTINCYVAADSIIIPCTVDIFCAKTVSFLFDQFEQLEIGKPVGIVLNMFRPSANKNKNLWNNKEAGIFFENNQLKKYIINTKIMRTQALHRIIAEVDYRIKGKTAENLIDFVSEITGEALTITFIGGYA
ncbi:MAG: ParA family protein [Smithellaceae bacterium]|nr:ParA family protein [Syntrophaceae bacterium]MBP8608129.1 ParA family protein [Syntrophaceae bacterium]NMD05109.1 ParA family protein [Deltaproteobacteria bacterium]OPZ50838.1 MAG: Chromosome-partitioning ATPase Soj [Deltaproteobacteria bacterium ADurb.BinA014]